MGKFAVIFVLAGLAVGLWLGFNPASHREIVRLWRQTTAGQASRERPAAAINLRPLDRRISRWLRSAPRPANPPPSEPGTIPSGQQISVTLHEFWLALQQLLQSILLKLGIHT